MRGVDANDLTEGSQISDCSRFEKSERIGFADFLHVDENG
jgi:hypothetical protein